MSEDVRSYPLLDLSGVELGMRVEFETGTAPRFIRVGATIYEAQFDDFCCLCAYQMIRITEAEPKR